jgi:hypothetical protein
MMDGTIAPQPAPAAMTPTAATLNDVALVSVRQLDVAQALEVLAEPM